MILVLLSLTTTCIAQEVDSTAIILGVSVPIAVIVLAGIIICVCYYGYYFCSSTPTATAEQAQRLHNTGIQRPSTTPYQTQIRYLNRQPHSSRTVTPPPTNLNFPPIGGGPIAANRTSQTVLQTTSEPVSLPEATLHRGEAPPAYAEAIKMKTVIIIDENNL